MTLLDASGNPTGEDADDAVQWMGQAIYYWLGEERTRRVLVEQGVFSMVEIRGLVAALAVAVSRDMRLDPQLLRKNMLKFLENRVVRIRIAADILRREYENRRGYEMMAANFDAVIASWHKRKLLGEDVGEEPQRPEALPPGRDRRIVMRELKELRSELEAKVNSSIVRPF